MALYPIIAADYMPKSYSATAVSITDSTGLAGICVKFTGLNVYVSDVAVQATQLILLVALLATTLVLSPGTVWSFHQCCTLFIGRICAINRAISNYYRRFT